MLVSTGKKSWEDQVTPSSGLQYSYDDLDLVCCHAVNGDKEASFGRHGRVRCASLPECGHHQPWMLTCSKNDVGEGTKWIKTMVQDFKDGAPRSNEGERDRLLTPERKTVDGINEAARHKIGQDNKLASDSVADQDELQQSALGNLQTHNEDHNNKELNKDEVSAPPKLSLCVLPNTVLAKIEETGDLSNVLKTKDTIFLTNSIKDSSELTFKSGTFIELLENNKTEGSQNLLCEHMSVISPITDINTPPPTSDSQQKTADTHNIVQGQCCETSEQDTLIVVKVECSYTDETMVHNCATEGLTSTLHITDANDIPQGPQNNGNQEADGLFESYHPEMFKIGSLCQPTGETSLVESHGQFDTIEKWQNCFSKLQTIHEGPSHDLGEDASAQITADMPECPTSRELRNSCDSENLTTQSETSYTEVHGSRRKEHRSKPVEHLLINETPLTDNGVRAEPGPTRGGSQPEGLYEEHKTNQTTNTSKDHEMFPKSEGSLVKLRRRKSSREEREIERSRLDSMVLLIMKLDQLDQEIENALSSIPSLNGTPNLKRHIISDVDLEMLDSAGSLSQSLNAPLYQSSSSVSSSGPSGTSESRPKNEISAVLSEKEIEAKEACSWLRAAGFPQYAQLYEDGQFPIEISSVTRDHDFLDQDAIEALCRRLNTLNKCALMRLEITPQRKRSEDSDEDEPCAISGRWTFQRDSKRWSRLDQLDLDVFSTPAGETCSLPPFLPQDERFTRGSLLKEGVNASAESILTDLSEQPELGSLHSAGSGGRGISLSNTVPSSPVTTISNANTATTTRASSVASICSSGTSGANEDSMSDGLPSPLERVTFAFDVKPSLVSSGAEKSTRSRAKSFLKRMESLRLRTSSNAASNRKKKCPAGQGRLEISGPVLKEGLDEDKLRSLNCVDIETLDHNANRNRSISYSTQISSGSAGSSQSEASSGSAVSTPSPVSRARSHSTAAGSTKRGGMYLEGFDPFNFVVLKPSEDQEEKQHHQNQSKRMDPSTTAKNNRHNHPRSETRQEEEDESREEERGAIFFYLPEGHKPGTFPKALADGGSYRSGDNISHRPPRRGSASSLDSRLSIYDNVPFSEMGDEEDEAEGVEEPKLEDVIGRVSGLQRLVNAWSETGTGEEEEDEEEGDSDSALDSASPCPLSPLQNRLEETENGSDQDSTGNPLTERDETLSGRERCDSGVGASLTRANRPQKLRWPSFQSSHRPSLSSTVLQVGCQSVLQMNLLQKYSLLKLTALLERYTPTNKHGFSWAVPKFMKRIKVKDYKDRSVFGVPLQVIVQRSGQPLPQSIQQAMHYLQSQCLDQVGLFRKSGVKSRIQALRQMNESCGTGGGGVNYEGQSAYDVADMLKQYFRDLPEPLLTSKLSDTFLQIYQYVPKELRLQAVRAAVLLLPDENREALQTLLCFLSNVTASVDENQMTCTNLAVCLAPSLFHLNTLRRESSSPRVMNRKNTLGKPDQRDLNENLAATHGLAHMIQECRKLFLIPEEMSRCRNSYVEQGLSPMRMEVLMEDCGSQSYKNLLKDCLDALLKEAKDKFKGYDSCSTPENAELACKKFQDGSSLRQWKVCVEVPASAEDVLQQILREQERWDEDLLECRVVETLEPNVEVYQYIRNSMVPHPPRDHVVLRSWVTDLPKGVNALVCMSVDHERAAMLGVRANVLTSHYYVEPCGPNKSRLTHISRIDSRGRCPEWYNKLYGHLCASEVVRIRNSFTCLDK
ncbi:rho GTPase-activating protein 7-like isoform X1 [Xyrauchen texanus]|uniref:rho GTPase-activating protein 7-like isoform X1 n=1 Tax=Xyrauchen texanus TaxID=154827 RepID=UPI002241D1AF|nr:rho GTPase-activating protein 7-like isoform X1 [Xyrauchen texanus]XP_051993702.1 rho GTPase-activating protein 7-like isoform X1 [Xyrauchen texanus]XP_051993703.1 rho GTPase-activating protein 7-like isoform X1 [Xyrauchen texanus]